MARNIFCSSCIGRIRERHGRYQERFREVVGALKSGDCRCDCCGVLLAEQQHVSCFTTHPKGPEVVMPWEHQYVEPLLATGAGSFRCSQQGCNEPAAYRYVWPGKGDQLCCERHSENVIRVGKALGMPIPLSPLEVPRHE